MRAVVAIVLLAATPVVAGAQSAPAFNGTGDSRGTTAADAPDAGNAAGNPAGRLLRDIASDYKNFLSIQTAQTLAIGGFAAGAIHAADEPIAEHYLALDSGLTTVPDLYGSQLLHIPVAIAWWTVAAIAGSDRHAAAGRDLLRAQLSTVSWTYGIKLAVGRTRPNGDPHSFPSGHASTSFATAAVLQRHYGWKLGLPAFLMATYTGASRIHDNQHWASDVVFGAAVGIASGRVATLHLANTRVAVAPLAVPGGGGVLVTATR